jgi:hypothetical protein
MTHLVTIARIALFVIPNCSASWPEAGAIMDDDTGEISVKDETINVDRHFLNFVQLFRVNALKHQ